MTIRLYLVRHGETPMNAARQLQGITDAALTAKGRAAADRLGELLRPVPFAKVFTSDRGRTIETAHRIIAGHQPQPPLIQLSALREYYFGGLEGDSGNAVITRTIRQFGWLPLFGLGTGRSVLLDSCGQFEKQIRPIRQRTYQI